MVMVIEVTAEGKCKKGSKLVADLPESSMHGVNGDIVLLMSQLQSHPSGRDYSFILFTYYSLLHTHIALRICKKR
jgi:hypothetical protein